ncbi:MAG: TetR/AcrR family transcriptional regulator [Gammaproteobacteria bacterium]|nr:TetR/AcrR family transcriptional regulator [Gammaproteobacteria bacterium]MCF6259074.1 TetR/AcrR family transcriptional regulator [Gammaproteobacteria bacterium]
MATQAERRAQTHEKLLNAAKTLFEKQGFEATLIDQVVKKANVAKGTFYQHFDSKLEILIALEREAGRGKTREALAAIEAGVPALPILESYLESLAGWFTAREKIAEAMILSSLSRVDSETTRHPELSGRGFIHAVLKAAQQQGTIRKDADAWELTGMVGGFITGSVLYWSRQPQADPLNKMLKRALTLFLEGAQTREVT